MKRRIFVAIPIPENIKFQVVRWQKEHSVLNVRWLREENLHITLAPPWYAEEKEVEEASKTIQEVLEGFESFVVRITHIMFGPPGSIPRLIWAEGAASVEFKALQNAIQNKLLENPRTGFKTPERRPTLLHLTLARFRPGTFKFLPKIQGSVNWKFKIESIVIMESVLKRDGAEYGILREFKLK